ncbi:heterokaryon incompatibility protein-domain-containing protein [Phyllosticta citrichinensis]|uniref:Heterokaryon incompatibility protein-domain-containing protein n=1 Tax=Phyllosticta citrichinensis TaxID=1130410 RepID=A0ABR1Y2J7_9PEZI
MQSVHHADRKTRTSQPRTSATTSPTNFPWESKSHFFVSAKSQQRSATSVSPEFVGALLLLPQCWRHRLANRPSDNRVAAIELISTDGASSRERQWHTIYNDLGSDHDSTAHSRTLYLHQPMSQSQTLFSAQLRPTIDWDRIRWLLLTCRLGHPKCNTTSASRLPENFRIIDVLKRCIKKADQGCHFVALSYVWGERPDFTKLMATKDSLRMLEREGSLTETKTPRTISDAMEACIQLGERYLWADRLCIIQDDEVGKQKQVDSMAAIFESAKFTIADTTGTVDTGIIGISSQRTLSHIGCMIKNLEMVFHLLMPQNFADQSIWSKRGWTLQEKILSKSVLYITKNQAYLGCQRFNRFEDVRLRSSSYRPDRLDIGGSAGGSITAWARHLHDYIVRDLSDTGDVFNAFAGITDALYPCPKRPLYGLPRPDFDRCLLWSLGKRSEKASVESPQSFQVPSWSWAYAKNFPSQHFRTSIGLGQVDWVETLVRWGCVADSQSHAFEWARIPSRFKYKLKKITPPISSDKYWAYIFIAVSWRSGCIEAGYPFRKSTEISFSAMRRDLKGLLGGLKHVPQAWLELVGNKLHAPGPQDTEDNGGTAELYLAENYRQLLRPGILIGRTQSAVFNVVHDSVIPRTYLSLLKIRDQHRNIVGGLECFPHTENHDGVAATYILEHFMDMSAIDEICDEDVYSFDAKHLSDRLKDFTIFDGEGNHMPFIPLVNVMAIEWNGPYARRLTVGWMLLSSWIEAEREFKTILLE